MNSDELKNIIETARIKKGISQREVAKLTNISRSTLNDLINGKIKKVDIDDLRKISETLDISLQSLLKVAGYNQMLSYFSNDNYSNKSSKDLKELIEKYKKSELDLLDFDSNKRKKTRAARQKIFNAIESLNKIQDDNVNLNNVVEDLKVAFDELKDVELKYDYNKLP